MKKETNNEVKEVKSSVSEIYLQLLNKQKQEKEEKAEKKRLEKEERQKAIEADDKELKMTKKEKREAALNSWKEVIIGLTGDDLDYESPKKNKKKYKQWIDEDTDSATALVAKPKKVKKKNYNKEFEPELNMLKSLVADQNKFTTDLLKRFQNMAGPATKDAMPLNKTLVDLAANINTSRANSLGVLREIGNIKRNIADLYMKQKKLDADLGNAGNTDNGDLALMGSSIASSIFGDVNPTPVAPQPQVVSGIQPSTTESYNLNTTSTQYTMNGNPGAITNPNITEFDPNSWDGPDVGSAVNFENVPKKIVVEWHKEDGMARFKAVNTETGEEIVGCPVPTTDPSRLSFNEKDHKVKGQFDEVYDLEIV